MILDKYKTMLEEIKQNPNIKIDNGLTQDSLDNTPLTFFKQDQQDILKDANIRLSDGDLVYCQFTDVSICWVDTLENIGEVAMKGGFSFNALLDALIIPSSFWKGAFSLPATDEVPEELKHFEQLGWFEKRPDGMNDMIRGCFIKQPGNFPPPIAFYTSGGWYTKLDLSYDDYLTLMFENYAFKGWQFFYIDIPNDIPKLDVVLEEMRLAAKMMPLIFPDKEWSYHQKKYEEVLKKLGRTN